MSSLVKVVFFLIVSILGGVYLSNSVVFKQDLMDAIEDLSHSDQKVFHRAMGNKISGERVFVKVASSNLKLNEQLQQRFSEFGYDPVNLLSIDPKQLQDFSKNMLTFLPHSMIEAHVLSRDYDAYLSKIRNYLFLPGGGEAVEYLLADPFGLSQLSLETMLPKLKSDLKSNDTILSFARKGDINFEYLEKLVNFLALHSSELSWTGSDFFAYENYRVIQRDILICSLVSLVISSLLFYWMTSNLWMILLLLAGTGFSYVVGILFLQSIYGYIYSVVLTFTSTFVGFNNEYLVHFSGIKPDQKKRALIGLGSAIGTTLIGFLVLLFTGSDLFIQIGIMSIGGMVGFMFFLWLFRIQLRKINFREIQIPFKLISERSLLALIVFLVGLGVAVNPGFYTKLESFRYASPKLLEDTDEFSKELLKLPVGTHALAFKGDIVNAFSKHNGSNKNGFHPLNYFVSNSQQKKNQNRLNSLIHFQNKELQKKSIAMGLPIKIQWQHEWEIYSPLSYLKYWEDQGLGYWGDEEFLVLSQSAQNGDLITLKPKEFYQQVLNNIQDKLVWVSLVGLIFMFVYLIPWQMSFSRIMYIFLPLLISSVCFFILSSILGRDINIIHIIGFTLVISVAIDYSSISSSSNFNSIEISKVFLTGIIALSSFGSLLFAKHPLIWDLGFSVVVGVAVSLVSSLMIRVRFS